VSQPGEDATAGLVDSHAHLDDSRLKSQLDAVLSRAHAEGVAQIVAISTTAQDSVSVLETAQSHAGLFAAVGVHPNDVVEATESDWRSIERLAREARVVAIGETGLDRYWKKTPFEQQQAWFDRHLDLARELDLPVVIHCRDCMPEILAQLARRKAPLKGVLHSFTGTWEEAEQILALGLHISFAGMITFANKSLDALRDVARRVPVDRVLVETDSPYLTPEPFRGKLNEPARVRHTAARLAELTGVGQEALFRATTANARRLFGLDPGDVIGTG
jgi:TatD DNase family protein